VSGKQRSYTLRPSRLLAFTLLALCAITLSVLWTLPWPLPLQMLLAVAVMLWTAYHFRLDARLRMPHSCVAFRLEDEGACVLVLRHGAHVPCRITADSLVTPYLVILNVELVERSAKRSLLILPDAMGAERFRHLRVALVWGDAETQAR
jgi:hypothetical protein